MPEPLPMDSAVLDVVLRALAVHEADVADVRHEWGEQAGMWFTGVEPQQPGAASLSVSFDGQDLLTSASAGGGWKFSLLGATRSRSPTSRA